MKNNLVDIIRKDIDDTITILRNNNIIIGENGTSINQEKKNFFSITYSTRNDTTNILYDQSIGYDDIIDKLLINKQFTVELYDKSIIQAEYMVEKNNIVKSRLVFLKKHNKIWDKKEIEGLEADDEDWFHEYEGIPTIIRFDYDIKERVNVIHPASHVTISNVDCCRIPAITCLSFSKFVKFIMCNFYDLSIISNENDYSNSDELSNDEKNILHVQWKI